MENIETIKERDFLEFYNSRTYTANCFNEDSSLNKNYTSLQSTGVIATIFEEHWAQVYLNNKDLIDKYRPNAPQEVQKIIDCYSKNLGCSLYEFPTYHDIVFISHTCKSRFCSSCDYKYKRNCREFRKQLLKYEVSISLAFNHNPYNCPKCDTKMVFVFCIN